MPTHSPPLVTPGEHDLSDFEKAKTHAESLDVLFQPLNDTSVPANIEGVNERKRTYSFAPASEPKLTKPMEVQGAIRGSKSARNQVQMVYRIRP